jgi:uncharacterized membrane protein
MTLAERFDVLTAGPPIEERDEQLTAGADELADRTRGPSVLRNERFLLALAGGLMTLGLTVILLGWFGASRSIIVQEQVPYLISGGLLGVALAVLGGLTLFSHWLTVQIRQGQANEAARQRDHEALVAALASLTQAVERLEDHDDHARSPRAGRAVRRAPSRT